MVNCDNFPTIEFSAQTIHWSNFWQSQWTSLVHSTSNLPTHITSQQTVSFTAPWASCSPACSAGLVPSVLQTAVATNPKWQKAYGPFNTALSLCVGYYTRYFDITRRVPLYTLLLSGLYYWLWEFFCAMASRFWSWTWGVVLKIR